MKKIDLKRKKVQGLRSGQDFMISKLQIRSLDAALGVGQLDRKGQEIGGCQSIEYIISVSKTRDREKDWYIDYKETPTKSVKRLSCECVGMDWGLGGEGGGAGLLTILGKIGKD